jgi:hypothetical protein
MTVYVETVCKRIRRLLLSYRVMLFQGTLAEFRGVGLNAEDTFQLKAFSCTTDEVSLLAFPLSHAVPTQRGKWQLDFPVGFTSSVKRAQWELSAQMLTLLFLLLLILLFSSSPLCVLISSPGRHHGSYTI